MQFLRAIFEMNYFFNISYLKLDTKLKKKRCKSGFHKLVFFINIRQKQIIYLYFDKYKL